MHNLTIPQLQTIIKRKGYKWFDDQPNLIGIRATNYRSDEFCDVMYVIWKQPRIVTLSVPDMGVRVKQQQLNKWLFMGADGLPLKEDGQQGANTIYAMNCYEALKDGYRMISYKQTTNSGRWGLQNPQNAKGTAVLQPGQHIGKWALGFHKGNPELPALVQIKPLPVERDNDRDSIPELTGIVDVGMHGINIHCVAKKTLYNKVGNRSIGCQDAMHFYEHMGMIQLCRNYKERGIQNFSYTLLLEADLSPS